MGNGFAAIGLAASVGWALAGYELFRGKHVHLILWGWVSVMFLYQGIGWVKAMRYFLGLYPLLALLAAYLLMRLCRIPPGPGGGWARARRLLSLVVLPCGLWRCFRLHQATLQVAASRWIFRQSYPQVSRWRMSTLTGGCLSVSMGKTRLGGMYTGVEMQHYNEDTWEKRMQLYDWLDRADYIFLASNRLYAAIPRLPARYPLTIEYYRA